MPLYECEIEVTLVVQAENETKARRIARRNAGNERPRTTTREIWRPEEVPSGWEDCVPYNAGSSTVSDILEE